MAQRLEQILYHALDQTGSIEVSTTSAAGPWTKLTLTSPKAMADALSEWTALAAAPFPTLTFDCYWYDDGYIRFGFSGDIQFWVRLSATLADLMGFSTTVLATAFGGSVWAVDSTLAPKGLLRSAQPGAADPQWISVGRTMPLDKETVELAPVRGGRATTYAHGRAVEVELELTVPEIVYTEVSPNAILGGFAAFRFVDDDDINPYSESHLGGTLDLYPIGAPRFVRVSPDDAIQITLRCSMEDPA